MNISIERDEFTDVSFIDRNAALPTVIVLNDQHNSGYFIPVSTMAKCGWIDFDETKLINHTFRSGTTEVGILIQHPRMLVCPKTDLYQFDAKASEEQHTKVIVGLYNAELKNDPNIKTERLYLVFFLDENNEPLHTSPLKYAARGVNGATFENERRAFKAELEASHAITNQVAAKPKDDRFHALGVFCFTTVVELVGEKKKHWCCRVVDHIKPTTENWKNYFVGFTHLKEPTWTALEPGQKIDVLSVPAIMGVEEMTLPPATQDYAGDNDDFTQASASLFPSEPMKSATPVTVGHASNESSADKPDIPF